MCVAVACKDSFGFDESLATRVKQESVASEKIGQDAHRAQATEPYPCTAFSMTSKLPNLEITS